MEDLYLKMQKLKEQQKLLLKQKLDALAHMFMRDNIYLLLDCFTYDYSHDIFFYEEMDRRLCIEVREFKEDIAPDYTFIDTFMAYPPLVVKLKELDIEEKKYDTFLFNIENLLDENHYFARLQLREVLKEKYPDGIFIEDYDQSARQYYYYVVLPEDEDYEKEKSKLLDKENDSLYFEDDNPEPNN
jgi:hypothetical protein